MLKRLCLSPSISISSVMRVVEGLATLPLPSISLLLLSPYVTYPLLLAWKSMKSDMSHVMCLENPLLRKHILLVVSRYSTYNNQFRIKGTQSSLGPWEWGANLLHLGNHWYASLGTKNLLNLHFSMVCPLLQP